jgi:putative transposase
VNIQNETTGNIFQKKTKAKCLTDLQKPANTFGIQDYSISCFHYIHQNPLQANLVTQLQHWKYSSFPDYYGYRNGTLCNKNLAMKLSLSEADFKNQESLILDQQLVKEIF